MKSITLKEYEEQGGCVPEQSIQNLLKYLGVSRRNLFSRSLDDVCNIDFWAAKQIKAKVLEYERSQDEHRTTNASGGVPGEIGTSDLATKGKRRAGRRDSNPN